MDNVLFYGERDEQTRRQVRSAAAAHSHRIGPRKPKATLRQSASSGSGSGGSGSGSGSGGGGGGGKDTPSKRRSAHHPLHPQQKTAVKQEPAAPATASSPTPQSVSGPIREQPAWAPTTQQHGYHAPAAAAGVATSIGSLHMHPPEQPRNGVQPAPPGLRSLSPSGPTSSPDSTQRLPQYSWTEYPRYGLGSNRLQSLEMLADVASSAPTASRSASPADPGLQGLRHFESSPEGRPILPPILPLSGLPTSSPHMLPGRDGGRQISAEARPQDVESLAHRAAKDSCAGFLQHARPHLNPLPQG